MTRGARHYYTILEIYYHLKIRVFLALERGDLGHSSRFETVVVSLSEAVPCMNSSQSLYGVFSDSTVVPLSLDKHNGYES